MGSMQFTHTKVDVHVETERILFEEDSYVVDHWMPAHQHQQSHIVLCLGGAIEQHSGKDSFLVTEKTLIYVPAYETHSNLFRDRVRTFQITLDESKFGLAPGETKCKSFHHLHQSATLMQSLFREFRCPDRYSQFMLHSLAIELLVSIHREEAATNSSNCQIPWLLQVRDLLHEELSENLRLESIAAQAGVHPSHLTKAFRLHFGQSIGEYVRCLRISRARHLLETTEQSIGAIAVATGFNDQSHFTRTFKKHTGRTPHSY